jgi:hypothetical protein
METPTIEEAGSQPDGTRALRMCIKSATASAVALRIDSAVGPDSGGSGGE